MELRDKIKRILRKSLNDSTAERMTKQIMQLLGAEEKEVKKIADNPEVQVLMRYWHDNIHPLRIKDGIVYINEYTKKQFKLILKEYTVDEIKTAFENFAKDEWWRENNGGRGPAWLLTHKGGSTLERFITEGSKQEGVRVGRFLFKTVEELAEAEKRGDIVYGKEGYREANV